MVAPMTQPPCARCGAQVAAGERFCGACGAPYDPVASQAASGERADKIGKARKWLLVICILTVISGVVMYFIQKSQVESQLKTAESQLAGMDPAARDALLKANTGMTWDEAVAHDRGQVNMLLVVNLVLAVLYLGMWVWAKKNALGATLVAFFLFTGVMVANVVMDPKTLAQGVVVKVVFITILIKAIQAAFEERKLVRATA